MIGIFSYSNQYEKKESVLKSGMKAKTDIITKEETILDFFLRKAPFWVDV